jgi:hypothetical protein
VDTSGNSAFLVWTDASGTTYEFYPDLVISEKWTENAAVTEHPVEQGANIVDHVRVELAKCELTIFATNEPIGANSFQSPSLSGLELQGLPGPSFLVPLPPIADVWQNQLALKGALLAAGGVVGGAIGGAVGNAVGEAAGALLGSLIQPGDEPTLVPTTITLTTAPQVSGQAQTLTFDQDQDFVEATIQLLKSLKDNAQIIAVNGSKEANPSMVIEAFSYVRSKEEGTGAEITIAFKEILIVQTQTVTVPLIPGAATPVQKGTQNPSDAAPPVQSLALQGYLSSGGT